VPVRGGKAVGEAGAQLCLRSDRGNVNYRAPQRWRLFAGLPHMPNFRFSKIRDMGGFVLVRLVHSQAAVVPVYTGGLWPPAVVDFRERHRLATAPQPHPRGVLVPQAKGKRQSHFTRTYRLFGRHFPSLNFHREYWRCGSRNRRPVRSPRYPSAWLKPAVSRAGAL
jgi:hypothetical protein